MQTSAEDPNFDKHLTCQHCGKDQVLMYNADANAILVKHSECFTCNHFLSLHRNTDQTRFFRIWGVHYSAHPGIFRGSMLGFGGRVFHIKPLDGRLPFKSNDVWCQGEIPEHLRSIMPDNAEFVLE